MNNILNYEDYNKTNEEFNLFPSYNDTIRKKLSFLLDINLDELKAGVHIEKIKDIMLKVDKIMKTKKTSMSDIIKDANVHLVQNMLDILKELKDDISKENKTVGYLSYFDDINKFSYNPGFDI